LYYENTYPVFTTVENHPEPIQTDTSPACTHDYALVKDLNLDFNIQEEVIAKLREDLEAKRALSLALAHNTKATPVTTAATGSPPRRIQDPGKYGGDRNRLCSFLVQLRLKAATFPTVQERLRFSRN
jgi:hypothetical protein